MEETQQRDSLFRFADKQLGGTIVLWFRFQAQDLRLVEAWTVYLIFVKIFLKLFLKLFNIHTFKIYLMSRYIYKYKQIELLLVCLTESTEPITYY